MPAQVPYKLIPFLSDPAAHGGDPADAFDVVAPSLPGYGFSEARDRNGTLFGFEDLWHKLMTEKLGYARFGAHGGIGEAPSVSTSPAATRRR